MLEQMYYGVFAGKCTRMERPNQFICLTWMRLFHQHLNMKIRLVSALWSLALAASAQGVVVNPDGTHSHIMNNGNTSVIVNPNGTHSTVFHNGNTSVIINPSGTHSTAFRNGNTSVIVNPNGTHSTAFHNGNTTTILNPDGTQSTRFDNETTSTRRHNDSSKEEEESLRRSYGFLPLWERGPVVPDGAFVDLSQWKSGPVIWVYPRRYKRKPVH